jgi:CRP-like cAMP-binding protein
MPPHDLLASSLEAIAAAAGVDRVLAAGEPLFRQGDRASAIYRIETGRLRLLRHAVDGRLVVLYTARAGDFFAEAALFSDTYHCDAVATLPSRVRTYPKKVLLAALRTNPALLETFTAELAQRLQAVRTRLELRDVRSARERVLQHLALVAAGSGDRRIPIEGRLQDIAADLGLTRETFYRTLAALEAEGIIVRTESWLVLKKSGDV